MTSHLEYVEPERVVIDGTPVAAMEVRAAAGRALGQFRGVVVDSMNHQLRYLVVRASRLFNRLLLVPAAAARVDFSRRVIEIDVSDTELRAMRNFTLDDLLAFEKPAPAVA